MQESESASSLSLAKKNRFSQISVDRQGIRGDILGGLAAALVALPQSLGKGALVFMPLGLENVHVGIIAGLYAAIAGGLVAALVGRRVIRFPVR